MDIVTFNKVFLMESFLTIALVATVTTISTSPDLAAHVLSNTALATENERRATWCSETNQ